MIRRDSTAQILQQFFKVLQNIQWEMIDIIMAAPLKRDGLCLNKQSRLSAIQYPKKWLLIVLLKS